MKKIYANNFTTLSLGRQGENLARQVVFDLSAWEAEYGPGTAELIHQRPGDALPYPVAAVREGSTLVWTLTATDTAVASSYGSDGRCELRWYVGETLAKSKTWRTWVESALSTPSETTPPEPEQGWVDQIIAVGAAAKASADAAKADADAAAQSASGAAQSAQEAEGSALVASTSETNAKASEVSAKAAQKAATESANAAANSAALASASASVASESASAAAASETAAKASEEAAKASETAAKASEKVAAESAAVYDNVVADVTRLKHDLSDVNKIAEKAYIMTDARDNKKYGMEWGVNKDGYPTVTFQEVAE